MTATTDQALSLEERATNFETMKHIHQVGKNLNIIVRELLTRGENHDASKLEPPEVAAFTEYTPKLATSTYGSPEYNEFKKGLGDALVHHYANNSHHPEWYRKDEEWRSVTGYEGLYEVSNYGSMRSLDRVVKRESATGDLTVNGRMLKQNVTPKGYHRIALQKDGAQRNFLTHVLVALAFVDNENDKPFVNHKNGVKGDNRSNNLEWVTSSENLQHAYDNGLKKAAIKYVVHCEELDIVTFGCEKMETALKERGYDKASAVAIWSAMLGGTKHLGLEFSATKFETWMDSPIASMNLIDLIELYCDWAASCKRHHDGNLNNSIKINAVRFGMSNDLVEIFENSVRLFE